MQKDHESQQIDYEALLKNSHSILYAVIQYTVIPPEGIFKKVILRDFDTPRVE